MTLIISTSVNTHFANYLTEKWPVMGQLTNLWASGQQNANFSCAKMMYWLAGQKSGQVYVSGQKTEANAALMVIGLL